MTGEPFILIVTDRFNKWPVNGRCKSAETGKDIKHIESFLNLYGVLEKTGSDCGFVIISMEVYLWRFIKDYGGLQK